jgi:hypothetical protein
MAKKKAKAEEPVEQVQTAKLSAAPLAPAPAAAVATGPARTRIGAEHKRLSKGQRKHVRRQKQAREAVVARPR